MFKKIKTFQVVFSEPDKVYSSGEKVAGRVVVEVAEVARVTAVKVLACGVAKVVWSRGPQQCKQQMEYLRYEDDLTLDDRPSGEQRPPALCASLLCIFLGSCPTKPMLHLVGVSRPAKLAKRLFGAVSIIAELK